MDITLIVLVSALAFLGLFLLKNNVTYNHQHLISTAIMLYCLDHIRENHDGKYDVYFDDKENYDKTLWRFWDWGYTRILPPEKYAVIEPFIEPAKEVKREERKKK